MKKFRKVLINWGIIYFLITTLIYTLHQWLGDYPLFLQTLILSGIMVFMMQYMISPLLEKLLNRKNHGNNV